MISRGGDTVNFSVISADEARRKFQKAENKQEMAQILCDLMCARERDIYRLVGAQPERKCPRCPEVADDIERMYITGMSRHDIADALGINYQSICAWIRRKIDRGTPRKDKTAKKIELYNAGLIDREIADAIGVTKEAIYDWRRRHNLPPNGTRGGARKP